MTHPPCRTFTTRLPLFTMGMALIALLFFLCGDAVSFLQYDRTAMAAGEAWRGITGHWLHWSFDHFLWCTITFLAIGSVCEPISRKGYIATLAAAGIIIPLVSWFADPGLLYYRGLSGLASATFVFAAVTMTRKAYAGKDWSGIWLPAAAGIAFAGKVLFEFFSGSALFVDNAELFTPVPLVHLAGGGVGLFVPFIFRDMKRPETKGNNAGWQTRGDQQIKPIIRHNMAKSGVLHALKMFRKCTLIVCAPSGQSLGRHGQFRHISEQIQPIKRKFTFFLQPGTPCAKSLVHDSCNGLRLPSEYPRAGATTRTSTGTPQ